MARSRAGLKKVVKTVRTKKGTKRQSFWVRAGEAVSQHRGKIAAGLGIAAVLAGGAYAYSRRGGSATPATASFGAGTPDPGRPPRKPRTPEAPGHFGAGTPDISRTPTPPGVVQMLHLGSGTSGSVGHGFNVGVHGAVKTGSQLAVRTTRPKKVIVADTGANWHIGRRGQRDPRFSLRQSRNDRRAELALSDFASGTRTSPVAKRLLLTGSRSGPISAAAALRLTETPGRSFGM